MKWEKLLGFPDIHILNVTFAEKEVLFELECTNKNATCPNCGALCESIHEVSIRKIRDRHMSDKRCWILLHHRRFKCNKCQETFMERLPWIDHYGQYTLRYAEWIQKLGKEIDVKSVSELEEVGYKTVERIVNHHNHQHLFPDKESFPEEIGIDEFSRRKGRKFAVVINDNKKHKPYDILPSKEKETLETYFKSIPEKIRNNVKSCTIDIWKTAIPLIQKYFSNAEIIIDLFHTIKCLNKCIDKTRRRLQNLINKEDGKKLKNLRWIILKNKEDITDEEKQKLSFAFELSKPLEQLYTFKEKVRAIFKKKISKANARVLLKKLVDKARKEIPHKAVLSFIKTYNTYEEEILNYFHERKSNGILEGINNKIKLIKRMAFGMTNFYHLSGRILSAF